jgi:hypothetical protein
LRALLEARIERAHQPGRLLPEPLVFPAYRQTLSFGLTARVFDLLK